MKRIGSSGRLLISEWNRPLPTVVCWTQPWLEDAALAALVRVAELALGAVGHHLDLAVRVQGPDGAGREGVVVEDAQGAEVHVAGIVVVAEGEVPAALEGAVLDPAPGLVDVVGSANGNRGRRDHG